MRRSDWLIWTRDWDQSWAVWSQFFGLSERLIQKMKWSIVYEWINNWFWNEHVNTICVYSVTTNCRRYSLERMEISCWVTRSSYSLAAAMLSFRYSKGHCPAPVTSAAAAGSVASPFRLTPLAAVAWLVNSIDRQRWPLLLDASDADTASFSVLARLSQQLALRLNLCN